MVRTTAAAIAACLVLFAARNASADTLGSRKHQRGVVTRIDQGVFQLGVDSTLLLNWSREGGGSASRRHATGAAMLRYFLRPKLGVSARVGGLYQKDGVTRDLGFSGMGWANYFLRLGEGMFFAPGAGAGFVVGQRDLPAGPGEVRRDRLVGALGGVELVLAVYLGERFSVSAAPDLRMMVGSAGGSVVSLDGSFKVGAVYSF